MYFYRLDFQFAFVLIFYKLFMVNLTVVSSWLKGLFLVQNHGNSNTWLAIVSLREVKKAITSGYLLHLEQYH